jgi:polyvinyl alcohol dehydrogenase (cytochrome)
VSLRSVVPAVVLAALCTPLAAASAAQAAPCSKRVSGGDWKMYGYGYANSRRQPAEHGIGPANAAKVKRAWVFSTSSTGDKSGFNSTPTVYRGCVYIGSAGGWAYALDASSGHVVWKRKLDAFNSQSGGAIVASAAIDGRGVVYLLSGADGPYGVKLDRFTGRTIWKTKPWIGHRFSGGSQTQYLTNASPVVANGLVAAGYSPPSGNSLTTGGFVLIDARSGRIVKRTPTIPAADQKKGYAGVGLWSTPAYDPRSKKLFWGSGNPSNKSKEHPNANSILKIDLDRRHRQTFGKIVQHYHGNVDQYAKQLQTLAGTPACSVSDIPGAPWPTGDTACGQLDLDFGASPNLFRTSRGRLLVGGLQKAGVYHVARTGDMKRAWTALVGVACQVCNGASTAFDGRSVTGVATPGSTAFSLARDSGRFNWRTPVGDASQYHPVSVANGVVWAEDANGNLNAFDAKTGSALLRRPMSQDAGAPMPNGQSSGVAIAEHKIFAAAGGYAYFSNGMPGYVIAYRGP